MNTMDTLRLVRETMAGNSPANDLAKAFTQPSSATTGLQVYDLEAPAKLLYPVLTPLRNKIPRVGGGRGVQANWRAITALNPSKIGGGLGQGNRGGVIDQTVKEYLAAFRGIGFDNYVTFEADMSAEGFQDLKATAVQSLLRQLMIEEEFLIVGGVGSNALGTTPTPTVTVNTTGGTIATATTVSVGCVALTMDGLRNCTVANGIPGLISRTNADGSTDTYGCGAAAPSAVTAGSATSTNASSVSAHVAPVVGAVAYAWYVGVSPNLHIAQITTLNSALFTSLPGSGQLFSALAATDYSTNSLVFDGFLSLAAGSGSGAYWAAQPTGTDGTGTPLTADGSGGVVEIDTALQSFWDNYRLQPTELWVASQEQNWIRKKVLNAPNSSVPLSRFSIANEQGNTRGGSMVRGYLSPFGLGQAQEIPIRLHPNLPNGTMLFLTDQLPYALNDVQNVYQMKYRRDYYQIEWPLRTRKYEYGCYADLVLQHYFPPSIGVITNIAPG